MARVCRTVPERNQRTIRGNDEPLATSTPAAGAGAGADPDGWEDAPPLGFESRFSFFAISRLEHFDERFLGNVDCSKRFHAFFAFFLFLEQFPFACDVAAVTFRGHVLAEGADR